MYRRAQMLDKSEYQRFRLFGLCPKIWMTMSILVFTILTMLNPVYAQEGVNNISYKVAFGGFYTLDTGRRDDTFGKALQGGVELVLFDPAFNDIQILNTGKLEIVENTYRHDDLEILMSQENFGLYHKNSVDFVVFASILKTQKTVRISINMLSLPDLTLLKVGNYRESIGNIAFVLPQIAYDIARTVRTERDTVVQSRLIVSCPTFRDESSGDLLEQFWVGFTAIVKKRSAVNLSLPSTGSCSLEGRRVDRSKFQTDVEMFTSGVLSTNGDRIEWRANFQYKKEGIVFNLPPVRSFTGGFWQLDVAAAQQLLNIVWSIEVTKALDMVTLEQIEKRGGKPSEYLDLAESYVLRLPRSDDIIDWILYLAKERIDYEVLGNDAVRLQSRLQMIKGDVFLLRGDEESARRKYIESNSLDRMFLDPYLRLGRLYERRGDWFRAFRVYQEALERNFGSFELYSVVANARLKKGHVKQAVRLWESYLEIEPDDVNGLLEFGDLLSRNESIADGVVIYERALSVDGLGSSDAKRIRKRLSSAYGSIGSEHLVAMYNAEESVVSEREGSLNSAIDAYTKSIGYYASADSLGWRASAYIERGDFENALKDLKKLYYETQHDEVGSEVEEYAGVSLIEALILDGQFDEAIKVGNEVVDSESNRNDLKVIALMLLILANGMNDRDPSGEVRVLNELLNSTGGRPAGALYWDFSVLWEHIQSESGMSDEWRNDMKGLISAVDNWLL